LPKGKERSYVENKNEKTPEGLRKRAASIADQMQGLKIKYDWIDVPEQEIRQKCRVVTSPSIVDFPTIPRENDSDATVESLLLAL
jgi:hypothetical protein